MAECLPRQNVRVLLAANRKGTDNAMIEYGGTAEQIEEQKTCHHSWYGPCRDAKGHYFKCTKCYCLDRDHWQNYEEADPIKDCMDYHEATRVGLL